MFYTSSRQIGRPTPADHQNISRRGSRRFKTTVVNFATRSETFSKPKRGRNIKVGHAGVCPPKSPMNLTPEPRGEAKCGRRTAAMGRTDDQGWTL
jgi:hypothetical protein